MRILLPLLLLACSRVQAATETQPGLPAATIDKPLPLLNVRQPNRIPERIPLNKTFLQALQQARPGQAVELPGLVEEKQARPLAFKPMALYAHGARVRIIENGKTRERAPTRRFFLAVNGRKAATLALAQDGALTGTLMDQDRLYQLKRNGDWLDITAVDLNDPRLEKQCETGNSMRVPPIGQTMANLKPRLSFNLAKTAHPNYSTVIAVDTDTEFLNDKFSNDISGAQTWIEDTFAAMNVFYVRDLSLNLQLGDVILRVGSDPYTNDGTADGQLADDLTAFGNYWMNNMAAIDRDFAMMFSGKVASTSYSGVGWVDSYCENGYLCNGGTNVCGSYSFSAIGSNNLITPAWASTLIGHELGHNLGSVHTHCYNPPLDNCNNSEPGCYSGTEQCPASGAGTIMSYCHLLTGCASNAEFHPGVIALLNGRISANYPACIDAFSDTLFGDGFE